jgi:5-methylcytosine-specific restriction endonuclease McrA
VTLGFPKPERRSRVKKRAARVKALTRAQCRQIVFLREHSRCQRCKRKVTDDCWAWEECRAHVNELVPRSRGGSPLDVANLELLCRECHLPGGQHAPTPERLAQIRGRTKRA